MDWALLIQMLIEAISNCREDDDEEVEKRIRKPRGLTVLKIRGKIRDATGMRGKELRAATREAVDELEAMSDEDYREVMVSVKELRENGVADA